MNEYPFQFAVLRYIHDPATQEFMNVGVALYSKEARFLEARINTRYGRLSKAFLTQVNGSHYRRVTSHLSRAIERIHGRYQNEFPFEELPAQIEVVLSQILSPDDSSLVFGGFGAGLAEDLNEELAHLFDRLVERYVDRGELPSRDEDDVWRVYKEEFDRVHVTPLLETGVTIRSPRYGQSYELRSAWRNERIHPLEPVSFDLVHAGSITYKANKWIGRTIALHGSKELGTLYMLVGAPRREELQHVYQEALYYLQNEIPLDCEVVEEQDAPVFSERLAEMMNSQ